MCVLDSFVEFVVVVFIDGVEFVYEDVVFDVVLVEVYGVVLVDVVYLCSCVSFGVVVVVCGVVQGYGFDVVVVGWVYVMFGFVSILVCVGDNFWYVVGNGGLFDSFVSLCVVVDEDSFYVFDVGVSSVGWLFCWLVCWLFGVFGIEFFDVSYRSDGINVVWQWSWMRVGGLFGGLFGCLVEYGSFGRCGFRRCCFGRCSRFGWKGFCGIWFYFGFFEVFIQVGIRDEIYIVDGNLYVVGGFGVDQFGVVDGVGVVVVVV